MKRILLWVVVPLSLVLVTVTVIAVVVMMHVFATAASFTFSPNTILLAMSGGKSIDVVIYNAGKRVDHQVPALAGSSVGFSHGYGYSAAGRNVQVQVDENYRVVAASPGHFQITMHRAVETDGSKTISDYTLPVWKKEPGADKRIKLPDGSTAAAYLGNDSP